MADRASTNRIVDVGGPKVGPNKLRLNNQIAKVAPKLARTEDLSALSRQGLAAKVEAKLADATAALDGASDARLVSQQVKTGPVVKALDDEIAKLTAQPVDASRPVPSVVGEAVRDVAVDPVRQYALKWMKEDMESIPFSKRNFNEIPRGKGGSLEVSGGAAGAPIYRAIVGQYTELSKASRADVIKAIDDVMAGKTTGKLRELVSGVADDLARGDPKTQKLMVTSGPVADDQLITSRLMSLKKDVEAPMPGRAGRPLGAAVEPGPNAPQIATLRRIRDEVAQLGPVAPYESVRRIRQAWDQVAKVKYSPAMSPDFLAKQGEAFAASRGTATLRDALAQADPGTAAANADYALFKSAHDVLKATEETERARPRVLRGIVARTGGAMVGAESGGVVGAGLGVMLGAMVERAAELAPTSKIVVARQLAKAADLFRGGQVPQAQAVVQQTAKSFPKLRLAARTAAPLRRTVEGASLPMAADNQTDRPPAIGQR
jgi:hypothetical protein